MFNDKCVKWHTKLVFPTKPYRSSKPFTLTCNDLWGPSRVTNPTGTKWFITFIHDYSRIWWVYLLKEKSEVFQTFKNFYSMMKNKFQTSIKILRIDNGSEYINVGLGEFLSTNGIIHLNSCVDTPQKNRVAERKNKHFLEVARSLLFSVNVRKIHWGMPFLQQHIWSIGCPQKFLLLFFLLHS